MAPEKSGLNSDFQFVRAGKLHFFCPLCKYHQSTSTIERVELKHHAQILVFTLALTLLFFPLAGWNGLLFYLPLFAGFEFVYRLRKRQALVCQSCGFDPFLYKQDVKKAREALRQHWQTRIEKENLFANLKLRNYQTGSAKAEQPLAAASNSSEISKTSTAAPPKSP